MAMTLILSGNSAAIAQAPPRFDTGLFDRIREDNDRNRAESRAWDDAETAHQSAVRECASLLKSQLQAYEASHPPEQARAKVQEVNARFKDYRRRAAGSSCPVNEDHPL